jgi:hypothetical protein
MRILIIASVVTLGVACGATTPPAGTTPTTTTTTTSDTSAPSAAPSSNASTPPTSTSTSSDAPGCGGFVGFASGTDAACQTALDAHCCAEEKACAADSGCSSMWSCATACPKGDAGLDCNKKCAGPPDNPPPGTDQAIALASCIKKLDPLPNGTQCGPQ